MSVSALSRRQKRLMFLTFDWGLVPIALYLAYALRFGTALPLQQILPSLPQFMVIASLAPLLIVVYRLPWIKLTALDITSLVRIASAAAVFGIVAMAVSYVLTLGAPRSVPIIFAVMFFGLSVGGRTVACLLLQRPWFRPEGVPVAIYGAGAAGIQMASALRRCAEVHPVTFVDDNPALHGLIISGLSVAPPKRLRTMVAGGHVERVLVAMPSLPKTELDALLTRLADLPCEVQVLPSYVDLISGRESEMKTVSPEALLGRDKVALDVPDIATAYAGRSVMVTGAGGSIGSELCRQLLDCNPARIVLFERSELALYQIDREIRALAEARRIEVATRLGSVCDAGRLRAVMASDGVEIVLHAAAYKHVPLVEGNELEGARNNTLGTQVVAAAAEAAGCERFILISTDKAVRPTNIMGASKRMAELVVQDMASRPSGTRFSMVRFGNVLGSSGSVLPLFQEQIRKGGPVTVTHAEVTRYFMTIPEAARLVLLAGAYSTGGEVFVLDMGKPMRILDIARRMIQMSGATVREGRETHGIPIEISGLRPGEKLYEELLIDSASLVATPHEKIMVAQEHSLSQIEVAGMLRELRSAVDDDDAGRVRRTVAAFVKGYQAPNDGAGPKPRPTGLTDATARAASDVPA
ncbi:polysaccharide biosynthesis protein [Gymnodinialimonas ceratoperidinii]|uniref:Polysaccharide biosynthesis protein n=1 Tax=Gymnodinialimonas ceratoperidinii TaxID=2856823 RepID=A0A8F6Y9K3_9RHOB|nr:nucleoside-diphosphate sugar epimerase/dehydratase [Gymnodinialimonas ceratoperidinii]QXT38648.1 polysaccharide biosynthesis protein [Gymnodinialimonas ceratoperidinii]